MKRIVISLLLVCSALTAQAGRSSANYSITTDTIDSAGLNSQSANYSLRGSAVGEFGAEQSGSVTSANAINRPGYAGELSDLLTQGASRLTHVGARAFDVDLPLSGLVGVECRYSSIYTVVFTFANTLSSVGTPTATATGATQPGPSSGQIDPNDAHNYIANLTAVPNAQYITVTLSNVNDSDGNFSSSVPLVMGLLIGDSNADKFTDAVDVSQIKSQSGHTVGASNFREDANVDGFIDAVDVSLVKSRSGHALPTP